jgi:hypothetical protein
MASTAREDTTRDPGSPEGVERGVNILTNSQPVIVDGADEYIEKYEKGEISVDKLYDFILNAEVVYVDRSKHSEFKESDKNQTE